MNPFSKRILSILLVVVMCLTMLPTTAFAAAETPENSTNTGWNDFEITFSGGSIEIRCEDIHLTVPPGPYNISADLTVGVLKEIIALTIEKQFGLVIGNDVSKLRLKYNDTDTVLENSKALGYYGLLSSGNTTATETYSMSCQQLYHAPNLNSEYGSIVAAPNYAAKDEIVTLTVTPNPGYRLESYTVTDSTNNELSDTPIENNQFIMPAKDVKFNATFVLCDHTNGKVTYTDNGNGTHSGVYACCNAEYVTDEVHSYGDDNTCVCGAVSETISVEITWGAMSFTYTDGEWNPESHTYADGKWTPDNENGNVITVTNNGNVAVNVTFTYTKTVDEVAGSFTESSPFALAPEEEKKIKLILTGKPSSTFENKELGSVTVTITLPEEQDP